jgi:hypothetical protein
VPHRVQSTCSIQLLSLCKFPWPPFPSLQAQVLVLLVHVRLFYAVRGVACKCAARPPHPEGGSCDPERAPDGALVVIAS